MTYRNAWGRLVDGPSSSALEVTAETLEGMFREVGLEEASAARAAAGLRRGTYLSFEDAAQSQIMWGSVLERRRGLSESKLAEVARRLGGGGDQIAEAAAVVEAVRAKYPLAEGAPTRSAPEVVGYDASHGVVRFLLGLDRSLVEQSYVTSSDGTAVSLVGVPRPTSR